MSKRVTSMARHGEVKIPVYKAILVNPVFTVSQLCDWTGLNRGQVYWTLSDLQKKAVLTTESAPAGDKRLPYRPALIYRLSSDPEKRRIISDAVAPFVTLAEKDQPGFQESYAIARSRLDDFGGALLSLLATGISASAVDREEELSSAIEQIRTKYEIAWSKAPSLRPQIESDLTRWQEYRGRLAEFMNSARDEAGAAASRSEFSYLLNDLWNQVQVEPMTSGKLNACMLQLYGAASHITVRNNLAQIAALLNSKLALHQEDPSSAFRDIYCTIAECDLRFGEPSLFSLDYVTSIRNGWDPDLVTEYNFANISLLMGREEDALAGWNSVLDLAVESLAETNKLWSFRNAVLSNAPYESTLVLLADEKNIRPPDLDRLENELQLEGAISVVSASPLEGFEAQPYILKPTLLSWTSEAYQAVRLSPLQEEGQVLYVHGAMEDAVRFPGAPALRVATGLVGLGLGRPRAWDLALKLGQHMRLLLVHGLRGLDLGRLGPALPPFEEKEETPRAPVARARKAEVAVAVAAAAGSRY